MFQFHLIYIILCLLIHNNPYNIFEEPKSDIYSALDDIMNENNDDKKI